MKERESGAILRVDRGPMDNRKEKRQYVKKGRTALL
jgi:hypothetical protein